MGSRTNWYQGDLWWIDAESDALLKSGTTVGSLSWYGGKVWDAQPIHGFTISPDGVGWLASADGEEGDVSFLLRVDLEDGSVVPIGPMGGSSAMVNGMTVVPEPCTDVLLWWAYIVFIIVRMFFRGK